MNSKVKVKVPKRSGFDKSHQNILTTKVGTLTPVLCDELIPNSEIDLTTAVSASLPPLASDTFMRCDLKMEAFFVPTRILYGGYEKWLTGDKVGTYSGEEVNVGLPKMQVGNATPDDIKYTKPGTLFDYLGGKMYLPTSGSGASASYNYCNIFPFLSYYKIWDDWYRNTQVQSPLFRQHNTYDLIQGDSVITDISNLPWTIAPVYDDTTGVDNNLTYRLGNATFDNDVTFGDLMQRNFGMDYFTIAAPNPQLGDAQKISFHTVDGDGNITIASLRAANSLQQFAERNSLGGLRMQDFVKNHYGANLSSGVAQRAVYLGSASFSVYSKGVYQNSNTPAGSNVSNPFANSVGAEFGSVQCTGESNLVHNFVAEEPGYLMVLASLVPRVTYSTGVARMLGRYTSDSSITDMANPLLENVGNQPIYQWELDSTKFLNPGFRDRVFGYTDRYADFKYLPDELHGLLRDGESLQSFALQRTVSGSPVISTNFLEIPTDYLDQVSAVEGSISEYGCWMDTFFKYRVAQPLSEYAIPSLQDPAYEHGVDVEVDVRGSRL